MKIYISGISGTGMGPLALMAKQAGFEVIGSDLMKGAIYDELVRAGIQVQIGKQDGEFLKENLEGLDWFVYTSALAEDNAELMLAREAKVKATKRDEFTAYLVEKLGLKMVAVAGTHGKTTTTAMIIWAALKLGLPVACVVGTTLGFAESGAYHGGDKYFVYEADEYDRNFLQYKPWLAVVTCVDYDHADIYKTREEYEAAFLQFEGQSEKVLDALGGSRGVELAELLGNEKIEFTLAGAVRREDATYALGAILVMMQDAGKKINVKEIVQLIDKFPGVGRRFEKLTDGIYTDYAHHPEEIRTTMEAAIEECERQKRKGVVVVYQPHQNTRQHEVKDLYYDAFIGAEKIYWLPTYLTRENPKLHILTPGELILELMNGDVAETAELDDELFKEICRWRDDGYLVILMTAGSADEWLRNKLK